MRPDEPPASGSGANPRSARRDPVAKTLAAIATMLMLGAVSTAHGQFSITGDASLRADMDTARSDRYQYRVRLRPAFDIGDRWSLHGFLATGDNFTSAYNSINENDDEVHVRHLFARYENDAGKFEIGIIPPYKGRVSSTGLSKEGWIKGARGVLNLSHGALELVVGELEDMRASDAIAPPDTVNYAELEYSGGINDRWSFEFGLDRLLDDNFLRGELRYAGNESATYTLETIRNVDSQEHKTVLSAEYSFTVRDRDLELFTFYAYSPTGFGPRAELTEDFRDFGHAFSAELSGDFLSARRLSWFAAVEFYEGRTRGKVGVEFKWR